MPTIAVNVAINAPTVRRSHDDSTAWRRMRSRWEVFQAIRSWLFVISLALMCVVVAFHVQ